jgi:hypothetical protein
MAGVLKSALCFLAIITQFTVSSCGTRNKDDNDKDRRPQDYGLTPSEQLAGEWRGIYRTLEDGKPIGDPSEIIIQFSPKGSMTLQLKDTPDARLDGRWQEFLGKSLVVSVDNSTIPRIAVAGKMLEWAYELQGDSLMIRNEVFQIKATKQGTVGTPPLGQPSEGIWGQWQCENSGSRKTYLQLKEPAEFNLSSVASGERIFLAKGSISVSGSSDYRLTPSTASTPIASDAYFVLASGNAQRSELTYYAGSRLLMNLGFCRR